MRTITKISVTSFLLFFELGFSVAQVNNSNPTQVQTQPQPQNPNQPASSVLKPQVQDGAYKEETNPDRRVVPPAYMRQADAMWQTRVWRVIDIKEKINLPLYYPLQANGNRISLFQTLKNALLSGEISAYSFNPVDLDDSYKVQLTKTEIQEQLSSIDTVQDENGNMVPVKNEVDPSYIRGYTLKEDWIFEKQRSVLVPTLLFICPRIITINKNTNQEDPNAGPTSLFWLYYPSLRPILAQTPVFNIKNDAAWLTFDDILTWKRIFASYIIQQSNVYDRTVASYMKGLDALLEGEKINDKIRNVEIDMWQY